MPFRLTDRGGRMQFRTIATIAIAFASTRAALAQSAAPVKGPHLDGKTPTECLKGANDWRNRQWAATPAPDRTSRTSMALSSEAQRIARECGAPFTVENTDAAALGGLIDLYAFVGDSTHARAAVARALATRSLTLRDRATALTLAMKQEIASASGYFGILDGAERYVKEIDALPDSLDDFKISAHSTMLSRYEYLDVDPGLQNHALALLALGRKNNKRGMVPAYMGLARAAADMLHPDSALRILDVAEKELGTDPQAASQFRGFRDRYALIGTKAAPITGQWWVNSSTPSDAVQPGNGKVTLIEFTAHWCMPCKNSYPGLRELAKHFSGKPFEGVMATNLYGYLGERRPLTPEQEVEADREYYAGEHELPFKVAINALRMPARPGTTAAATGPSLDELYRVGGIPQLMIVDKHGVIRQIVTGWDHGNTERFTRYIEELIKER
jgi:thiol-disulfide isomerase/thioredoxin